ncbi:DUF108 domain-containing protein [Terrilactibacillus sp. S3-3]|nr:DUF108 domain-containing protein [Terrilactibacillus sp. S3-3]
MITKDEEAFFHSSLDVIIENAGHKAVYQYAVKSLSSGSHFIAISVGALADQDLLNRIEETAKKYQQKLFLPSAAIAGLDRIAAASLNDIDEIKLVTRKPVNAWKGTLAEQMVNLDTVTEPCCIYDGYAKESATLFPQSTNVSATLSLAGIGFEKTKVQVFVDPGKKKTIHTK